MGRAEFMQMLTQRFSTVGSRSCFDWTTASGVYYARHTTQGIDMILWLNVCVRCRIVLYCIARVFFFFFCFLWNKFKCCELNLGRNLMITGVGVKMRVLRLHKFRTTAIRPPICVYAYCRTTWSWDWLTLKYLSSEARGGFRYITKYGLYRAWEFFPRCSLAVDGWEREEMRVVPARTSSTPPPRRQTHLKSTVVAV